MAFLISTERLSSAAGEIDGDLWSCALTTEKRKKLFARPTAATGYAKFGNTPR